MVQEHRVVIVGGGFGGLHAALSLKKAPLQVTLIDRRNFHLFQPLLYQVATGGLSPANIASPLRAVLKRQRNTRVLLADVADLDVQNRKVILRDGLVEYDTLIVATGARHHYFGKDRWEPLAPGLKTIEDATDIRRRILLAFESAEREMDAERIRAWLTFMIVGGGPTGVELAGAVGELAQHTLRGNFRRITPSHARILLVEADDRILPTYPPVLSAKAADALARLGVTTWTNTKVTEIEPDAVTVARKSALERVPSRTVLWAAGVKASPLGRIIAEKTGAELDRAGRVMVAPDLSVPGRPELLVIGDLAHVRGADGKPVPGVAPAAIQQGDYAALVIRARLDGRTPPPPFRYKDYGNMATIGGGAAVADFGWLRLSGYPAWLAWLFIHLIKLIQFENRVLVLFQWAWNYFTRNRSARLITGEAASEPEA